MAFSLEASERGDAAVTRVAQEITDAAIDGLMSGEDRDDAVHAARKTCKRLRALLRVVRPQLDTATFRRENARIHDAARLLSGARDRAVLGKTSERLIAAANDPSVFGSARPDFTAGAEATDDAAVHQAVDALRAVRDDIPTWGVRDRGWKTFERGLRKIYADGADAMHEAARGTDDEAWHEWRKQAKYLWHGFELLEPTWPGVMTAFADKAHDLSDALGDEHDLQVLAGALREGQGGIVAPPSLGDLLASRRAELQTEALALGARLYAENPKVFTRRLGAWHDAWHADAAREAVGAAAH